MSRNRLREWWMERFPVWTWPFDPWGNKGRPDMPERHEVVNELTALRLRIDRLQQRDRLRAQANLEQWRERHDR